MDCVVCTGAVTVVVVPGEDVITGVGVHVEVVTYGGRRKLHGRSQEMERLPESDSQFVIRCDSSKANKSLPRSC